MQLIIHGTGLLGLLGVQVPGLLTQQALTILDMPRSPLPTLMAIIIIYSRIKGVLPMNYKWGNSKFNCPRIKWFKIMFHKFLKGPRGKEEENTWNKGFSPNNRRRERNGLLSLEEGLIQRQKNNSTHKRWEMRLSLMSDSFRTIPYQRYALFTPTGEPRFTDSPDRYLYLFMSSCSVLVQISVTLWVFWEQVSDLSRNSNRFCCTSTNRSCLTHIQGSSGVDTLPLLQWCLPTISVHLNERCPTLTFTFYATCM